MKTTNITWKTPVITLELSKDEVDLLCLCSHHHYDAKCRHASVPGPDAFLNGWKFQIGADFGHGHSNLLTEATFDILDTSAKILEMPTALGEAQETSDRRFKLMGKFHEAMQEMNRFSAEERVYMSKYHDLVMRVGKVVPDESRHDTAKRFIAYCEGTVPVRNGVWVEKKDDGYWLRIVNQAGISAAIHIECHNSIALEALGRVARDQNQTASEKPA